MVRNQVIKGLAPIFGIDAIGVTDAADLADAINYVRRTGYKYRRELSYSPKRFLKVARSVIVAMENYYACDRKVERLEGSVARYTWSNYYYDLKKRLRRLANVLSRSYKMHYRIYCNGPIAEKPLAVKAGIGYYGKHSIILNKDFGSWVVIGEIITDLEIETDAPLEEDCGDCHLCIDSCPTGAIKKPYQLDWSRCIQYLSNHRARVGEDIFEAWGNRLYGCTTCQEVCPKNRYKKQSHPIPEYGYVGPSLPLLDILILDEARFRERYHRNQIGARWVELACLKRNAILALAHSGDRRVSNHIRRFKDDPDPMIAAAARWAIKRLSCSW